MQQSPEIPKPRQLPCEAIYREGWFIGRVRVEAIRSTESGTALDVVLLEILAHRVFVSILLEDLKPLPGQSWTCSNDSPFSKKIKDQMHAVWLWNIDFRESILDGAIKFSRSLNLDIRSSKRFYAILDQIKELDSEWVKQLPPRPPESPPEPIRAKKVTDPEMTKNFDFDIFEEDGNVFRYINGYRKKITCYNTLLLHTFKNINT
jgi:hypothetical protein